jgi:hypothetical protein
LSPLIVPIPFAQNTRRFLAGRANEIIARRFSGEWITLATLKPAAARKGDAFLYTLPRARRDESD